MPFYDGVAALVDQGRATDVAYLDLCKAFKALLQNILVSKLKRHRFDKYITRWIRNWLDCHSQRVVVNSLMFKWRPVTSGVAIGIGSGVLWHFYQQHGQWDWLFPQQGCVVWLTCWQETMPSRVLDRLERWACNIFMNFNISFLHWSLTKRPLRSHVALLPSLCDFFHMGVESSCTIIMISL